MPNLTPTNPNRFSRRSPSRHDQRSSNNPQPVGSTYLSESSSQALHNRLEGSSVNVEALESQSTSMAPSGKRRKARGSKKKRARRKSFAAPAEESHDERDTSVVDPDAPHEWVEEEEDIQREESVFNSLPQGRRRKSVTRDTTETLLDRREQMPSRPRRASTMALSSSYAPAFTIQRSRPRQDGASSEEDNADPWDENAPLLVRPKRVSTSIQVTNYGAGHSMSPDDSSPSLRTRMNALATPTTERRNNVNYPPSIPGSPTLSAVDGTKMTFGDVMIRHELSRHTSDESIEHSGSLIDVDDDNLGRTPTSPIPSKHASSAKDDDLRSGHMHHDEDNSPRQHMFGSRQRERRRRRWPDLAVLEDWSVYEKDSQTEMNRAKKITEPQLINGRLRPTPNGWHVSTEEIPYRFTYFNEELPSTIHSQSISDLVQADGSFRELFVPERRILSDEESDSSSDEEQVSFNAHLRGATHTKNSSTNSSTRMAGRASSTIFNSTQGSELIRGLSPRPADASVSTSFNGNLLVPLTASPQQLPSPIAAAACARAKTPQLGERPVWWLDVMNPTEAELKVLAKAFGIHPLTAEDIMLQEAREKVELFRHYYFVNYRTFDQDPSSGEYLEPVNMYVVVFREGVLSFHFGVTPHAANVRRRVRQLRDYLIVSSDWISYAIIDDITDAFVPLIQSIEDEVDDIDEAILKMHTNSAEEDDPYASKAITADSASIRSGSSKSSASTAKTNGSMLRRVGDCRKRVILLYRLLGNKADVIKGFAKRCNERWEVAPRSEIGLYLGDIQDHIVTMTANLSHYERMLSRSHANYLAQINIEMNERQEKTADVLGKLTVLGTIVLPMNIITGLWGMNVWVPGQGEEESLVWFMWISTGLLMFGGACYMIAKRVYNIV